MNLGTRDEPIKLTKENIASEMSNLLSIVSAPTAMDKAAHKVSLFGINSCDRFSSKVNGIEYSEVIAYMGRH